MQTPFDQTAYGCNVNGQIGDIIVSNSKFSSLEFKKQNPVSPTEDNGQKREKADLYLELTTTWKM